MNTRNGKMCIENGPKAKQVNCYHRKTNQAYIQFNKHGESAYYALDPMPRGQELFIEYHIMG